MYNTTKKQREEFIKEVAPLAQNSFRKYGKVKPSVAIGMSCVESNYGWGTTGTRFMYKQNAVLGQKVGSGKTATKDWGGRFFIAKTQEEYTVGNHTVIKDAFRAYRDLQQCFDNYYELLNTYLYAKVLSESDYINQMKQIKQCGYMTSSTEVNSVLKIINDNNLIKYDNILKIDCYEEILNDRIINAIAKEVIEGKWGNGALRKIRLKLAGYDYDKVQKEVNRILKG